MRNSSCCLFGLVSFLSISDVIAQPVATNFQTPVWPVDQSRSNKDGYYNANIFLQLTSGRGYHTGEDWNGNQGKSTDYGDLVYPIAEGKVVKIFNPFQKHPWGKTVIVRHRLPDGGAIYSLYAHLSKISVGLNQIVYTNKALGKIGDGNGYYAGAAHLHLEIRRVNDWTPTSPGYYKTLTVANALKYRDPSLFLDNRMNWAAVATNFGTFRASSEDFEIPGYAPASLAYVTKGSKTLSLSLAIAAGWLGSFAHVRTDGTSRWKAVALDSVVFSPDTDFEIEFLEWCTLTFVIPGNNFQASRARDDMILVAQNAGFTRVKLETLAGLEGSLSDIYDLRTLCFDDGPGTGVGCAVHATDRDNPLERWVVWTDPVANVYIGDWIELSPNDIE